MHMFSESTDEDEEESGSEDSLLNAGRKKGKKRGKLDSQSDSDSDYGAKSKKRKRLSDAGRSVRMYCKFCVLVVRSLHKCAQIAII